MLLCMKTKITKAIFKMLKIFRPTPYERTQRPRGDFCDELFSLDSFQVNNTFHRIRSIWS